MRYWWPRAVTFFPAKVRYIEKGYIDESYFYVGA